MWHQIVGKGIAYIENLTLRIKRNDDILETF